MSASGPCPRCGGYYSTTCGQGSGWFIYDGPVYDGAFSALDVLKEATTHYTSDRRTWRRETAPILNQRVEVCMRCGFIYGEATELQKKLWGVQDD